MLLTSCNSDSISNKDAGAITGGVVGGLLGSTIGKGSGRGVAIAAGAVAGTLIGSNIGESMDEANRVKMSDALENTQSSHSRTWTDPDTKARYTIKPDKSYYKGNDVCRNYKMSVVIDGELQNANGTACRDANGNWQIVH